ncbi:hypothetical protein BDR04DRAFT_1117767 [Suillus decipiens]|nr:hypothetical protein BDR04DRAFT_1117767 [Suillus decipiens]
MPNSPRQRGNTFPISSPSWFLPLSPYSLSLCAIPLSCLVAGIDISDFKPIVGRQITQDTDVGHAQFAKYVASNTVSQLNDARRSHPPRSWTAVFGVQERHWDAVVYDAVANHVVKAFYENMVEDLKDGDTMDCTKAAWALNRATCSVKTKVPLEQRMVFIHIAPSPAIHFMFRVLSQRVLVQWGTCAPAIGRSSESVIDASVNG